MAEAGVLDEALEPGKRHTDQVLPLASDLLESVIDPTVTRLSRHLREKDEDQLVEGVVLIAVPQ